MADGLIETNLPPPDGRGGFKRSFRVMMRPLGPDPKKDGIEKAVFVDGKKIDFTIDVVRFLEARQRGPRQLMEEQMRIEKRFVKAVSDALGRRVTTEEIKRATAEGWI